MTRSTRLKQVDDPFRFGREVGQARQRAGRRSPGGGRLGEQIPVPERREGGRLDAWLRPDPLVFERSGWFLVRAVAENRRTFRFASTAPYYVEIGKTKSRISRRSVQFFLDWIDERAARVQQKLKDPARLSEVLKYHGDAKRFWRQRMSQANSE